MPPIAHGFVADINASFVKQVLYVSQRKWKPDIQHDGQADDFRVGFEILEWIAFRHSARIGRHRLRLNPVSSDTAAVSATNEIVNVVP